MKLINILARDLKTWPTGAVFAVQDRESGTTVKFAGEGHSSVRVGLLGLPGVWQSRNWCFTSEFDFITELSDDWSTAVVSKSAWKQACSAEFEHNRAATLDDLVRLIDGAAADGKTIAEAIYDAGYRKS